MSSSSNSSNSSSGNSSSNNIISNSSIKIIMRWTKTTIGLVLGIAIALFYAWEISRVNDSTRSIVEHVVEELADNNRVDKVLIKLEQRFSAYNRTLEQINRQRIDENALLQRLNNNLLDSLDVAWENIDEKVHSIQTSLHDYQEKVDAKLHRLHTGQLINAFQSNPMQFRTREALQGFVDEFVSSIPRPNKKPMACTSERRHFVYIKNHKCASDTMSSVFRRFGYTRNLSLVLPVKQNYNIGWPWKLKPYMYRASKHGLFDILADHTVYDPSYMAEIMKPDSLYMTSVREPFNHLLSVFNYFKVEQFGHINVRAGQDALTEFLKDKEKYDAQFQRIAIGTERGLICVPPNLSVVRNMMSFNLKLPVGFYNETDQQDNLLYIRDWLENLGKKFNLVLITEYFSESLVMLKRTMCWTAKDLFYTSHLTRGHTAQTRYSPEQITDYLLWTLPDTLLYAYFNKTFWEQVQLMGAEDFQQEVLDLKQMQNKTAEYCAAILKSTTHAQPLTFEQTKWNPTFELTKQDCQLLTDKEGMRNKMKMQYDLDPVKVEQPPIPAGARTGC